MSGKNMQKEMIHTYFRKVIFSASWFEVLSSLSGELIYATSWFQHQMDEERKYKRKDMTTPRYDGGKGLSQISGNKWRGSEVSLEASQGGVRRYGRCPSHG